MAQTRRRWIDDDSDEYESEDELETQATSISPARRNSIVPLVPSLRDPREVAVDCLSKQVRLMAAPYQFILIGLPYKLKTAKKVKEALFESEADAEMYDFHVIFKGQACTGKCLVTVKTMEAALAFVHIHGKKIGSRTVTVDVAPMGGISQKSNPRPVPRAAPKPLRTTPPAPAVVQ